VLLRKHRQWMSTDEARVLYARRQELSEPTFGILKDQLGGRRFLLRGLANVRAEFTFMATAFNLRTLYWAWNRVREVAHIGIRWQFQLVTPTPFQFTPNSSFTAAMATA
jgi:hypothetical protein